ncbi:MAG: phosphoglycerate dehydrogenase, partial [Clostridium sp.]
MKVLVTSKSFGKLSRKPIQRLQDAGFEVYGNEKGRLLTEEEMVEAIQGIDAVILGTEVFNRNVIDHADRLKIVSRYGVGLDKIDVDYLEEKGIALRIARYANTNSVADHAVGLMLSVCHNITRSDANIRAHVWKKPIAKDLYQSTVGILGLGAIGKAVARRLKGFDCRILAFDSMYDEEFLKETGVQKADIAETLEKSDFLTLHLPALPEFSPLLDAAAFSRLKKDAVIVNTARAKLIDRNALYDALHKGQLYGYGSDVHFMEPGFDEELIACEHT